MARGALMMAGSNPRSVTDGLLIPLAQFEDMNHVYLAHSMDLLVALSTCVFPLVDYSWSDKVLYIHSYWANMLEIKIAAQPVALYGTQTTLSHRRVHQAPMSAFYLG